MHCAALAESVSERPAFPPNVTHVFAGLVLVFTKNLGICKGSARRAGALGGTELTVEDVQAQDALECVWHGAHEELGAVAWYTERVEPVEAVRKRDGRELEGSKRRSMSTGDAIPLQPRSFELWPLTCV